MTPRLVGKSQKKGDVRKFPGKGRHRWTQGHNNRSPRTPAHRKEQRKKRGREKYENIRSGKEC